jgi:hypothetical protein
MPSFSVIVCPKTNQFRSLACHKPPSMTEEAPAKRVRAESTLEQLQQYTVVVADTGDFDSIRKCVGGRGH